MKKLVLAICVLTSSLALNAQKVQVEVSGIRNDKGNILIMAQNKSNAKPIYALSKAVKGKLFIEMNNFNKESYDFSVFHDENSNMQLDMNEQHTPIEGYARKSATISNQDSTTVVKMKLYYPVAE
jgi:uncharacterized protein (DUF2141 family)